MGAFQYRWRTGRPRLTVEDYRRAAHRALPGMVWAYVDGGAEDERTLRSNRDAFVQRRLRQRVLTGVKDIKLGVTIAGTQLDLPILLAPTGLTGLAHWRGELGAAQAAEGSGTRLVLSTASSYSIEEVATGTERDHWFQLYPWGDRQIVGSGLMTSLLERAQDSGYGALVVTVDVPLQGNRVGERRNGMGRPPIITPGRALDAAIRPRWWYGFLKHQRMTLRNIIDAGGAVNAVNSVKMQEGMIRPDLDWADLQWIRDRWVGPMFVKGLLDPLDAVRAVDDIGANGVIVSNHGGRQLNGAMATLDALPAIKDAVGDRATILLDGGVRSGTDVITALALGADAVLVGRPFIYGLAVDGDRGVTAVLGLLAAEMRSAMTLMGVSDIADLTPADIL